VNSQDIKLGKYRHFKGKEYEVIGLAKHSETLEDMVVYKDLYGEGLLWVRPVSMFIDQVQVDGQLVPRFVFQQKTPSD
jgi:cyclomaltodextrinase